MKLKTSLFRLTLILTLGLQTFGSGQTFTGQVFILADDYLVDKCEAFGECDCCTGDLFFLTGDKFCYVSRCISGDDYVTGTYQIKTNKLRVTFDTKFVSELTDDEYNVIELETKTTKPDTYDFNIASCGRLVRLTHPTTREWKNGSRYSKGKEQAMINELTASKVWKQLSQKN